MQLGDLFDRLPVLICGSRVLEVVELVSARGVEDVEAVMLGLFLSIKQLLNSADGAMQYFFNISDLFNKLKMAEQKINFASIGHHQPFQKLSGLCCAVVGKFTRYLV